MLAALILAVALPNVALTPGAVFPTCTAAQVCKPGYAGTVRNVTLARKRRICGLYHAKACPGRGWEVDHLISLELCGSNDDANLWAQPLHEAREKDKMENALHRQVCAGQISLQSAQEKFRQWARSGHW